MNSITKQVLSHDKIKELVARHFPQAQLQSVETLEGGMFNAAYLLELRKKGEALRTILKVSPAPGAELLTYERDNMQIEVAVYGLLADKGLPMPRLLASDLTRTLLDSDYFFMSVLEGTRWDVLAEKLPADETDSLKRELGRYYGTIHTVKGEYFGYLKKAAAARFSTWSEAFRDMMDMVLSDGRQRGEPLPYDSISQALHKHLLVFDEVTVPTLVDFDLWAGNILIEETGGRYHISGIIDFERAYFGDPLADFAAAIMIFTDVENEGAFKEGYTEISGKRLVLSDSERLRLRFYHLYMALLLTVETYKFDSEYAAMVKAMTMPRVKELLASL